MHRLGWQSRVSEQLLAKNKEAVAEKMAEQAAKNVPLMPQPTASLL
jgi:hypothetical protein